LTDAYLFTDGRYFLQAEEQLDENWILFKQGLPDVPTWQEFLIDVRHTDFAIYTRT
jgi:Xaa-Pro aminopeptidase